MENEGDSPESTDIDASLELKAERVGGRKFQIMCRYAGKLIHSDTLDPHDATARVKFARSLVAKVHGTLGCKDLTEENVGQRLLDAAEHEARREAEGGSSGRVIESVADPHRLARLFMRS